MICELSLTAYYRNILSIKMSKQEFKTKIILYKNSCSNEGLLTKIVT